MHSSPKKCFTGCIYWTKLINKKGVEKYLKHKSPKKASGKWNHPVRFRIVSAVSALAQNTGSLTLADFFRKRKFLLYKTEWPKCLSEVEHQDPKSTFCQDASLRSILLSAAYLRVKA